jgi:hypothetical protein
MLAPNAEVEIAFNPQPEPPARFPVFRICKKTILHPLTSSVIHQIPSDIGSRA